MVRKPVKGTFGLATKVGLITSAFLALLISALLFIVVQAHSGSNAIEKQDKALRELQSTGELARTFSDLRYWLSDLAIGGEYESEQQVNTFRERVGAYIDDLSNNHPEIAEALKAIIDQYVEEMLAAADAFLEEDQVVGNKHVVEARKIAVGINEQMTALLSGSAEDTTAAAVSVVSNNTFVRNAAIMTLLGGVGFGALLFLFFSRSVVSPISLMRNTINTIERESDLTQRVIATSADEIGDIGRSINAMLEKFQGLISQVTHSTFQLASASEEMSAVTQSSTSGIERQQLQTAEVARAISKLSDSVNIVTEQVTEAAQAAGKASAHANTGQSIVEQTIISINNLASEVKETATIVENLNHESESIGAVLDVIRGIAEQTNLLALNAAIEAARAGEQGRGFAVVADEVRTLASRTQEATEEIQSMIEGLQEGARNTVAAIEKGRQQTQISVEQAAQAGEALTAITATMKTISSISSQTADTMDTQNTTASDINANIISINDIASETATGSRQVAKASDELAKLSATLQTLVSAFKV